jgi:hypothetical protein
MAKHIGTDNSLLAMALVGYEAEIGKINAAIREIQAKLGQRAPGRPKAATDGAAPARRVMSAAGRQADCGCAEEEMGGCEEESGAGQEHRDGCCSQEEAQDERGGAQEDRRRRTEKMGGSTQGCGKKDQGGCEDGSEGCCLVKERGDLSRLEIAAVLRTQRNLPRTDRNELAHDPPESDLRPRRERPDARHGGAV